MGKPHQMTKARSVMETAVGGLYYLANGPRTVLDGVSSNLVDTNKLLIENKVLREQLREKNADLLLLDQLKVENQRLRLLLNSPLRTDEYKKIAEVLTAETDVYRQQVVINQGERDGAYVGQPVIDERDDRTDYICWREYKPSITFDRCDSFYSCASFT